MNSMIANQSKKNAFFILLMAALLVFAGACSEAVDGEGSGEAADGEDDQFISQGKADFGDGIEEGSLEAQGILLIVNTYGFDDLDAIIDLRAARSIIAFRSGPDGVLGTSDDRVIYNLAALDGLSWVGPRAFGRLYDFMVDNDLVPGELDLIHGFQEGSPAAIGILTVVNTLSFDELDTFLDSRAASGIVAYREETVTQEPRFFHSLQELDQISYMGASAFSLLHGYALDEGYINVDEDAELTLTSLDLEDQARELQQSFESSDDYNRSKALRGYSISSLAASTRDVTRMVRDFAEHEDFHFTEFTVEEAAEYKDRTFINEAVIGAVEATYGTSYRVGLLEGSYFESYDEWHFEIVVFHFVDDRLAVVFNDEYR